MAIFYGVVFIKNFKRLVATIGDRNILCAFAKAFRYILEILDMDSDKRSFEMYIN